MAVRRTSCLVRGEGTTLVRATTKASHYQNSFDYIPNVPEECGNTQLASRARTSQNRISAWLIENDEDREEETMRRPIKAYLGAPVVRFTHRPGGLRRRLI
jgi:hypothetical protein